MKQFPKLQLVRSLRSLLLVAAFAGLHQFVYAASPLPDRRMALDDPDQFHWRVFVNLCVKAGADEQTTVTNNNGVSLRSNNALWESWADNPLTFPGKPNTNQPPRWANRLKAKTRHGSALERSLKRSNTNLVVEGSAPGNDTVDFEEVRRNEASFDYIVRNGLYYQEGLTAAYFRGVTSNRFPTGVAISFPSNAIEVKADWAPINKTNAMLTTNNCHWNIDATGQLWGLVGFHIMTKALPNWTWATFEWVGNPTTTWKNAGAVGRSDWIGTRDSYGYSYGTGPTNTRSFQAPVFTNGLPSRAPYPGGQISRALKALFEEAGYRGAWSNEWRNYRLKGSQVDFVTATGTATLLGNSSTEGALIGNLQNSSCITCHAAANIQQTGQPDGSKITFVVGPANPANFFQMPANVFASLPSLDASKQFGGYQVINIPADFIWSFLDANSVTNSVTNSAAR